MAVKTFTSGETLTASDTNTYLANAGLVYVTDTSVTSGSELIVDNCFTSSFRHYRLIVDLSSQSADDLIVFQYRTGGSSGSNYTSANYDTQTFYAQNSTATAQSAYAQTYGRLGYGYADTGYFGLTMDIFNPQAALKTVALCQGFSMGGTTSGLYETDNTIMRVTTSMTGIRFYTSTSKTITGRVAVYGYRIA